MTKNMKTDDIAKLLDALEEVCIASLRANLPTLTSEQARNIVGKIGSRIMFGKEVSDEVFVVGFNENKREDVYE